MSVKEITRASSLHLIQVGSRVVEVFNDGWGAEMPLLRNLYIEGKKRIPLGSPSTLAPLLFSQSTTPSLTNLWLSNYQFQWRPNIFPLSLVNLHIAEWHGATITDLHCSDVVDALGNLHLLETLNLDDVLLPSLPPSTTMLPPILSHLTFPRLTSISLSGDPLSCAHFLSHCIFSDSATDSLHFDTISLPTISAIAPILWEELNAQLKHRCRDDEVGVWRNLTGLTDLYMRGPELHGDPQSKFYFYVSVSSWASDLVIGELFTSLPLQDITTLSLQYLKPYEATLSHWMRFFEHMRGVDSLYVTVGYPRASDVGRILRPLDPPNASDCDAVPRFIMPKLKAIEWRDMRLSDKVDNILELAESLKLRREAGCAVVPDKQRGSELPLARLQYQHGGARDQFRRL